MATVTVLNPPSNNNTTTFRAWGGELSAALTTLGFPKTADTGQIDWATVAVAGTSAYAGYEIRAFSDTIQATAPLVFKIEYGTGTAATAYALRVTVGKGSDGVGGITGAFRTLTRTTSAATASGSSYVCNGTGKGALLIAMAPSAANGFALFAVERSRDTTGAATAVGISTAGTNIATNGTNNYATGASAGSRADMPAIIPATTSLVNVGGKAPAFPYLQGDGAGNMWMQRDLLTALAGDVPHLTPLNIPGFGTFMSLGTQFTSWATQVTTAVPLIRWE